MLTLEEKDRRRSSIGSSDIPLIALGPQFGNQSLYELYLSKIGADLPDYESEETSLGSFLEPGIAAMFAHRERKSLVKGAHRVSPVEPWMGCTTDYEVWAVGDNLVSPREPCECKCYHFSEEWGSDNEPEAVPPAILVQVQWQMACMGAERGWVAALVGGDFRAYPVPRSQVLIGRLIELGRDFWFNHVVARVPPEPTWTIKRTSEIWAALNPIRNDSVFLSAEAEQWAAQYLAANEGIARLEKEKIAARNRLLTYMGDAKKGILSDGRAVSRGKQFRVQKLKGANDGYDSD